MNVTLHKRWSNASGDILVRASAPIGCGIVEMLHLYCENRSGCVIAAWYVREDEGQRRAELRSVQARLANTTYEDASVLLEALRFGQKLADVLIEAEEPKPLHDHHAHMRAR